MSSVHSTRKGTFVKTTRVEYKLIPNWQNIFFSDVIKEQKTAKSEDSLAVSLVVSCIYDKEN